MQPRLPVNAGTSYRVVDEIARGGMGVVLLALRTEGQEMTPVAIKQLHAHLVDNHDVVSSFVDEARIASRLHHPNVVTVHAVEMLEEQLVIVMDYVEGMPLRDLVRDVQESHGKGLPVPIMRRIMIDVLHGLHAAHELVDEHGAALGVVHRDVSPHNLLIGTDGVTRVTDFGIALAKGRLVSTKTDGAVKGKLQYLTPEQVLREKIDRRTDVFAAGLCAWEALVGRKLFDAGTEGEALAMVIREPILPPSHHRLEVPLDLDETVLRALERDIDRRFPTALDFAHAIEGGGPVATREEVGALIEGHMGKELAARRERLAMMAEATPALIEALIDYDGPTHIVLPTEGTGGFQEPRRDFRDDSAQFSSSYASAHAGARRRPPARTISPSMLVLVGTVLMLSVLLIGFVVKTNPSSDMTPTSQPAPTVPVPVPVGGQVPAAEPTSTSTAVGTVIGASPTAPVTTTITPTPTTTAAAASVTTPPPAPAPAPRPTTTTHRPTHVARKDAGAPRAGHPFMPDDL